MNPQTDLPADLLAWVRLSSTSGIGPVTARRLLGMFGPPEQLWRQSDAHLRQVLSHKQLQSLRQLPDEWALRCTQLAQWLAVDARRGICTLADAQYPAELLEQADPPLLLYWQGNVDLLRHPHRLSVVGSRHPTHQGAGNARDFARTLGQTGFCIVSGLALGVDGAAHEGALEANAPTIAVVGTGLDRVYPAVHKDLAHRIAASGLLISEFSLGTPPTPGNFPKRNRMIAGLSQGTLVVEATLASGSLITARMAADFGREVFAIPGSIHAPQAKGCHALIREGAQLVETAQHILEELRLTPVTTVPSKTMSVSPYKTAPHTAAPEKRAPSQNEQHIQTAHPLFLHLQHDPVSFDSLQARTGLETAALQAELLNLELDGHISRLPGGMFQRLFCA
ncbi:MAG: protecting protein DprA [Pseudomonadota bacterium]